MADLVPQHHPVNIEDEMKRSYMDYAMSVIIGRALPDARLQALGDDMMTDLDNETVDFVPNYDETTEEPTVLPAPFPNLLVNGSAGIAVGMATNVPPHNLREVVEGCIWLIEQTHLQPAPGVAQDRGPAMTPVGKIKQ